MLTNVEMRVLAEMLANKDKYLDYIESNNNQLKSLQIIKLYEQINEAQAHYYSSVGNEALSRNAYAHSLKEKKIDPFIAGGAAQAIGGIIPGILAASSTASRNKSIDTSRSIYKSMAESDIVARKVAEEKLRPMIQELDILLDSEPLIHNYRLDLLESDYQTALKLKNKELYDQAKSLFISLGNYKDSSSMATECSQKKLFQNTMTIGFLSGILSLFILLLSGVIFISINASLIVFCISFIISFIVIAIMMQPKKKS